MDRITIPYGKSKTAEEAYSIVREKVPEVLSKWKITADITWEDSSRQVSAKGKGFAMDMKFEEGQVLAEVTLSFPLSVMKKTILPALKGEFEKYL